MTEPLLLTLNFNLPTQDGLTGLRRLLRKKKLKRKVTVNLINALTPIVVELLLFPLFMIFLMAGNIQCLLEMILITPSLQTLISVFEPGISLSW